MLRLKTRLFNTLVLLLIPILGVSNETKVYLESSEADVSQAKIQLESTAKIITEWIDTHKSETEADPTLIDSTVRKFLLPLIDTDGLGRRLLTRDKWNQLSEIEQSSFTEAFLDHLIHTYANGLLLYSGETFLFEEPQINVRKNSIRVESTMFSPDGKQYSIDYTLIYRNNDEQWKVIDISVDGIKIIQNYREQLKGIDTSSGIQPVIDKLRSGITYKKAG